MQMRLDATALKYLADRAISPDRAVEYGLYTAGPEELEALLRRPRGSLAAPGLIFPYPPGLNGSPELIRVWLYVPLIDEHGKRLRYVQPPGRRSGRSSRAPR